MQDAQVLDRSSAVPLYYQLQEILKEQIESGEWPPGSALPPELKLAGMFGVSRICVRQALQILEDDREIVRLQGRGTFVAERKLAHRPVGLVGLANGPEADRLRVRILDTRFGVAERAILASFGASTAEVGRLTALWFRDDEPFAIGQHFFPRDAHLFGVATTGRDVTAANLEPHPVDVSLTIESTQCGQFEAELLGIPNRSTFLLSFGTVRSAGRDDRRPVEVFRLGFRGDSVQLVVDD